MYSKVSKNSKKTESHTSSILRGTEFSDGGDMNVKLLHEIHTKLQWISPCMYRASNFCVLPGADEGVLFFTKSGKVNKAHEEIENLTKMGILLCTEAKFGFLHVYVSSARLKEFELFQKHISENFAHVFNSEASVMPSHLMYSFPSAFAISEGSPKYDVYFTVGGHREKVHMSKGDLSEFPLRSINRLKSNAELQKMSEHEKVNITSTFGAVFPNFYIKDTLHSKNIRCYREGIIGKQVAVAGNTFLPNFVDMSKDRDLQIQRLHQRLHIPFRVGKLQNTIEQSTSQKYRKALLEKLNIRSTHTKYSVSVLFALRRNDRHVLNIENLIEATKRRNLDVKSVYMDDLSVREQIQHGLSADIIVGPEGSNLWITFWQEISRVLIIFQNPHACIARCEWFTKLEDGKHPLYYPANHIGVWSRIAWYSGVHAFIVDAKKCDASLSLRSREQRLLAHVSSSKNRRKSYIISVDNFEKVLQLSLDKLKHRNSTNS